MASEDRWEAGDDYEPFIGRWSRLVAKRFLEALDPEPSRRWLDVGCGTGALTQTIIERAAPAAVHGIDPSAGFIRHARSRIDDARADFSVATAQHLDSQDDSFDYVVSGLVLNFVPEPLEALGEMCRVARDGGSVAIYVWDYAEGMQMLRYFWDAARDLDTSAEELDEGKRFPICRPDPLRELWDRAGLGGVAVEAIDIPTSFGGFDDYWKPFLGGQGPAPSYVASLDPRERDRLRDLLAERLPVSSDGSISLTARAWGISGALI